MSRRIRFTLCYDGTDYHGWQLQPGLATIQGTLENVLGEIEGSPVHVLGSGRTDAGVHALAQVAACDLTNPIPCPNLRKAMNRLLPPDIRVLDVQEAPPDFHPRFHAKSKTYEYRIWRGEICPPFERRYVYHFPYPINEQAFLDAAAVYVGEHDFSAFAAADPKDSLGLSKVRRIFSSQAFRHGELLIFRVCGSGFLKHMVRNLVGGLIEIARGNLTRQDLADLLLPGRNSKLGFAAPARGLFLTSVEYNFSPATSACARTVSWPIPQGSSSGEALP
ncbi:MAG: tRNA pseudouridine(38-40) synthase TruA [Bryobacteraceae bacterium]|nr:tRNA pseudouridine(38-40) synthase TruA [Bryobacteraceae bacterium]MDW8378416.1 tRNA pseudouridine(38-40) synthase TruA [Bryobacterales bacterium]